MRMCYEEIYVLLYIFRCFFAASGEGVDCHIVCVMLYALIWCVECRWWAWVWVSNPVGLLFLLLLWRSLSLLSWHTFFYCWNSFVLFWWGISEFLLQWVWIWEHCVILSRMLFLCLIGLFGYSCFYYVPGLQILQLFEAAGYRSSVLKPNCWGIRMFFCLGAWEDVNGCFFLELCSVYWED